jgi:hypothetical protein
MGREERDVADAAAPVQYKVLIGLNYPPNNRRAEIGDVVSDLPGYAVKDLLRAGVIEEAS